MGNGHRKDNGEFGAGRGGWWFTLPHTDETRARSTHAGATRPRRTTEDFGQAQRIAVRNRNATAIYLLFINVSPYPAVEQGGPLRWRMPTGRPTEIKNSLFLYCGRWLTVHFPSVLPPYQQPSDEG